MSAAYVFGFDLGEFATTFYSPHRPEYEKVHKPDWGKSPTLDPLLQTPPRESARPPRRLEPLKGTGGRPKIAVKQNTFIEEDYELADV